MVDEVRSTVNGVPVNAVAVIMAGASGTGTAANQVQGTSASGVADDGSNPLKFGGLANTAKPTSVANGQRINAWFTPNGMGVNALGDVSSVADGLTSVTMPYSIDGFTRPLVTTGMVWNGTQLAYARGDTIGSWTVSKGGASIAAGQASVTTSATLVAAARAGRQKIIISSTSAVAFYVGPTGVTASTGLYVAAAAGTSIPLDTAAAVYAVGAGAVTLSYIELF